LSSGVERPREVVDVVPSLCKAEIHRVQSSCTQISLKHDKSLISLHAVPSDSSVSWHFLQQFLVGSAEDLSQVRYARKRLTLPRILLPAVLREVSIVELG